MSTSKHKNSADTQINSDADANSNANSDVSQNNWYTKLHPMGTSQQQAQPKQPLNLSIFFRIWLAVALILIVSGIVVFTQLFEHVKPTAQQVIEDTLFDTSKMMAANLQEPVQSGQISNTAYQQQLDSAFIAQPASFKDHSIKSKTAKTAYNLDNEPEYKQKTASSFRLYVTNSQGIVLYDSLPASDNAEGADYSRWNDVYLTLRGQYGARSTPDTNSTRGSSIMYVAQPIKDDLGHLIGVVSVGKPVDSVLPYLNNTRQRMLITTLLISIVSLILAGLVAWWLQQSISLVTRYTSALAEDTKKPYFYLAHELNSLTDTIESMKHRLENRAYVSDYVHTLTHELKSPLTAIRASGELLEDDNLDLDDRQMLSQAIGEQSIKMQQLIDRLLLLAKVEQPTFRLNRQAISLTPILTSLIKDSSVKVQQRHLTPIKLLIDHKQINHIAAEQVYSPALLAKTTVAADRFWLVQALQNVLDNAIYFASNEVSIEVTTAQNSVTIDILNDGQPLPDYAIAKAFDRYFSLSHQKQSPQANGNHLKKGTGLGLTLVKQVIEHHGGSVSIDNVDDYINHTATKTLSSPSQGVLVRIILPLAN
ncbi:MULTISPECIES: two-component system sensor histidine kinase CreC [unclassified Psychrobacter]|jgi:two-component system sensor histidine kinase CreC|uniref:two-component system sensor histidine kinase CreC n=1 Tax=unclassified Psychrobacter TaxID=196806 RepID=UPI0003FBF114|nr:MULTISPECIES: two-component system sensor histidine kinase CreC [unclassified Psychrobacter]